MMYTQGIYSSMITIAMISSSDEMIPVETTSAPYRQPEVPDFNPYTSVSDWLHHHKHSLDHLLAII